jgi:proteic killer suppression protein
MIKNFSHKGLKELFEKGKSRAVSKDLTARALRRLDFLHQAVHLQDLNVPGFDFHPLKGRPKRYSIHVNGNYCITFRWDRGDAKDVKLEDYH